MDMSNRAGGARLLLVIAAPVQIAIVVFSCRQRENKPSHWRDRGSGDDF